MTVRTGGALVIHLRRATARAPQVAQLQAGLPLRAEVLEAVDGRSVGAEALSAYDVGRPLAPRFPFPLLAAEVACFLSHRAAWKRIIAHGWEAGLILEDDAGLEPARFRRALALAETNPGAGIVQFQSRPPGKGQVLATDGDMILSRPVLAPLRATCNLYSRAACERLLQVTERFDRPVDVLLQMHWVTGLRPLVIWPSGLSEASADVGGTTIQRKNRAMADRLNREIRRPLFRAAMAWRARRG